MEPRRFRIRQAGESARAKRRSIRHGRSAAAEAQPAPTVIRVRYQTNLPPNQRSGQRGKNASGHA